MQILISSGIILAVAPLCYGYQNTLARDVVGDGPFSVKSGECIPVTVILKDGSPSNPHNLEWVKIYEDLNYNDRPDNREYVFVERFDPPLRITERWWYKTYYVDISKLPSQKSSGWVKLGVYIKCTDYDEFHHFYTYVGYRRPTLENWYAGDLHVHSWYTDIFLEFGPPVEAIADAARVLGLDFVHLTDHGSWPPGDFIKESWSSIVENAEWVSSSDFLMLPGEEKLWEIWLPPSGLQRGEWKRNHMLILVSERWIDDLNKSEDVIDATHAAGGLAFAAHPGTGYWEFKGLSDGLEVWNGDKGWDSVDDWALAKWDELLKAEVNPTDGFYVGIGNSDAHELSDLGRVRTYLYLPHGLTRDGIREALRNGHAVFSDGPLLVFDLQNCGAVTGIGDFKSVPQNTPVTLNFEWSSNEFYGEVNRIETYFDDYLIWVLSTEGTAGSSSWKIDVSDEAVGSLHYIRAVGYTELGNKCYTNPVWIKIESPDLEPPTVSITSYPSYVTSPSATLEWTTYDYHTGVERCEVYLNGTLRGYATNSWIFDGLVDGTYEVEIVAYDYAGNSRSHSITFRVDTTVTPTAAFQVTLTFYKPDGSTLANTTIYYGTSKGQETNVLGTTDSQGRITSTNSALGGQSMYFESSDGKYAGSVYITTSGGEVSLTLTETTKPVESPTAAVAGFVILICFIVTMWKFLTFLKKHKG